MVSDENLEVAKQLLKIYHNAEDDHIKRLIESSHKSLSDQVGTIDMDSVNSGSELVFERVRYMYNDALEYFDDNFRSQITQVSLQNHVFKEMNNHEHR